MVMPWGSDCAAIGTMLLDRARRSISVEALPILYTDISVPRTPSWRTMLVCGAKPSRTWATSRM